MELVRVYVSHQNVVALGRDSSDNHLLLLVQRTVHGLSQAVQDFLAVTADCLNQTLLHETVDWNLQVLVHPVQKIGASHQVFPRHHVFNLPLSSLPAILALSFLASFP